MLVVSMSSPLRPAGRVNEKESEGKGLARRAPRERHARGLSA
ncbi:hypothetical protein C7S16_4711 [Burkholderia thailandensis]|uniref:Uncharacterized protein n=1 Tax=Burkholderia thailandensis TaxID=57975 RepID=A0AAW9CMM3_BURTH|nr:hypothetical protein [Burkholderia thailandensis]MDW9252113.1 hypothetical protein [Burkholderia thailandensis]